MLESKLLRVSTRIVAALAVLCAAPAQSASFDCAKASTRVEKDVCDLPHLSNLDTEMGALFQRLLKAYGPAMEPAVREAQKSWLRNTRDAAATPAELMTVYESRVREMRRSCARQGVDVADIPTNVAPQAPIPGSERPSASLPPPAQPAPATAPALQAKPNAEPPPAPAADASKSTLPATLEAKLLSQGFRYMFGGKEAENWGRRIVTMDREGIRAFQWVQVQNGELDWNKDMVYFKCATKEVGMPPAGEPGADLQWHRVRSPSEVAQAWPQLCATPIVWPTRSARPDTPWTAADEARFEELTAPPRSYRSANAAQDRATYPSATDADPVSDLLAATVSLRGQCVVFRSMATDSLRQIQSLRQATGMNPAHAAHPNNSSERTARQLASTVLNAMRKQGCA